MRASAVLVLAAITLGGCIAITDFDVADTPIGGGASAGSGAMGGGGTGGGGTGGGVLGTPCEDVSECPTAGTDNDCQRTTCRQNRCEVAYIASGTRLPVQTLGDCLARQCGDTGVIEEIPDPDPANDANECTDDVCMDVMGEQTTVHLPVTDGTTCGNGLTCTAGECAGCTGDVDCPDDTDCVDHFCDIASTFCQSTQVGDGERCTDDGDFCNGEETCQNGSCTTPNVDPCDGPDGDADCSETCDAVNGNCEASDPMGSPCDDGMFCTTGDHCEQGQCKSEDGLGPCPGPDGDANCMESCDEMKNDCSANDPEGFGCLGEGCCYSGVCLQGPACTG